MNFLSRYKTLDPAEKRIFFFVSIVTLVGASLRIYALDIPMRYDEAYTYRNYISHGLTTLLKTYNLPNNHIFHSFLGRITTLLLGSSTFSIRLPVLFAGIILIPISYFSFKEIFNKPTAIISALFIALWPLFIDYSANARGYMIQTTIYVLMLAAAQFATKSNSKFLWLTLTTLTALCIWTVPTGIFAAVSAWSLLLLPSNSSMKWRQIGIWGLISIFLTIALYLPVLLGPFSHKLLNTRSIDFIDFLPMLPKILNQTAHFMRAYIANSLVVYFPYFLLGLITIYTATYLTARNMFKLSKTFPIIFPIILLLILSNRPFPRNFLFIFPYLIAFTIYALGSLGSIFINKKNLNRLGYIFCIVISIYLIKSTVNKTYQQIHATSNNAQLISQKLEPYLVDGDIIAVSGNLEERLNYYFEQNNQIRLAAIGWDWTTRINKVSSSLSKNKGNTARYFIIDTRGNQAKIEFEKATKLNFGRYKLIKIDLGDGIGVTEYVANK